MPFLIGKPTPQGYACLIDNQDGKVNPNNKIVQESDTYQCAHARGDIACQRVIHVPTGTRIEDVADFCRSCKKVICARCASPPHLGICFPFMKAVEDAEEKNYRLREYGLPR